jgi:hypothetical protein
MALVMHSGGFKIIHENLKTFPAVFKAIIDEYFDPELRFSKCFLFFSRLR